MESKPSELITVPRSRKLARRQFLGGSDPRIITSAAEAAVMRRRRQHEQNIQCLGVVNGNAPRTPAHAAKSPAAQTPRLMRIGRHHSRSGHRQQQIAENLTAFMTAIQRFMKAYAILCQKLYARFSENDFDQANRVLVSRVATLNNFDRISMKTGRLSQVPNRPIDRSTRHPDLCACQQARNAKQPNQGRIQ
jgi:hypothetical protein